MIDPKKQAIIEKLQAAREALLGTARELSPADWTHPVYTHTEVWTAADILRHLTDAETGMMRTMQNIQQGGGGVPEDFDRDRWNASRVARARHKIPAELMAEMADNREALLAYIEALDEEDLARKGRHASLRIMSIEEILHQIAEHEEAHLDDMRQALSLPGRRAQPAG